MCQMKHVSHQRVQLPRSRSQWQQNAHQTTRDGENVARRLGITVAVPSRTASSYENITISKADEEMKGSTFQSVGQNNTNMPFTALLFTFTLK